ncbi:MAG: hypothetical protein IKV55_03870 [Oscillospiraceae bacterium]|nr:hypothetical protein [Oscillospiraceae bacterium]
MGGGFGGGFDMGSRGDRPKTESTGENHAQNGETPTPSGGEMPSFDMGAMPSSGEMPSFDMGSRPAGPGSMGAAQGGAALALVGCVVVLLAAMLFAVKYRRR